MTDRTEHTTTERLTEAEREALAGLAQWHVVGDVDLLIETVERILTNRLAVVQASAAGTAADALRERMEALADEFDAKGRRGSAHFGADIGDTIRLWLDRDPRGECNHPPEHVTNGGLKWPLVCDACRTAAPEETA